MVIWKQLEQSKDDILLWAIEAQKNMQEAIDNLTDTEIAKIKLDKFRNELQPNMNNEVSLETKMDQLKNLNTDKEIISLKEWKTELEKELEYATNIANDLENALGNLGESSKKIREDIKKNIDCLNTIREELFKCEDTSGTDDNYMKN